MFRNLFLIIFLLVVAVPVFPTVGAAAGISISPPNVKLEPGRSYVVTIQNSTQENYEGQITESLFKLEEQFSVRPLVVSEIEELNLNLSEYITFDKESISVAPGGSEDILVTYLKAVPDHFIGVTVITGGGDESEVSLSTGISSFIVDYTFDAAAAESLVNPSISIEPSTKIFGIGIGNTYDITLKFNNLGNAKIASSGNVFVSILDDQKVKVDQFTVTPDLIDGIEPGDEVVIIKSFTDTRDIFSRGGDLEVLLELNVEGTDIEISDTSDISIALEHLLLLGFILTIGFGIAIYFSRQKRKLKLNKKG